MNRFVLLLIALIPIEAVSEGARFILGGDAVREFNIDHYGQIDLHMRVKCRSLDPI